MYVPACVCVCVCVSVCARACMHVCLLLNQLSLNSDQVLYCQYIAYTYLLTPWCRVLLEKITGLQLVKKFPAFHRTRRFITALTSVCHLSLSWASPIQSIYPHPTSWRSILTLSAHLRLGLPNLPSGPCHHGMARPQVVDRGTASNMEGSCE